MYAKPVSNIFFENAANRSCPGPCIDLDKGVLMADKLNLNKATVGDLERISGITRTLAQRIVAVRDRQGGVTNLAALRDINVVTDDLFDILKENVALDVTTDTEKTQLVHVLLDPDQQHKGAYGGYKVTAELVALRTLTGTDSQVAVPQAVNRDSDADGVATLTLPDKPLIQGLVTFTARAPNGEIMARDVRAGDTLSDGVRLPVTPRRQPTTQPTDDPTFNQPRKLRGRVIDREGRMQIANKQVVI